MNDHVTTRRVFLQKGLTLLAVTPTIPAFLDQTVMAMANPLDVARTQRPSGTDGKILVVVQLSGGNDGLNTVIPYADDAYHRVRPALAYRGNDVLRLTDYFGLHPNLAPLKNLYDRGEMGIIQGVGYPNPNRSHFRSMDIWHSARPDEEVVTTGWIGRYFDNTCDGQDPHVGVSIGDITPVAMQGDRIQPLSFERPEQYRYAGPDRDRYEQLNTPDAPAAADADAQATPRIVRPRRQGIEITSADQLSFLERTAMDARVSSDDILRMTARHQPITEYPRGEFGDGLRTVAAMIGGGLSTRVYYVSLGGFDTHANQRGRHDNLMQQFAQGVAAFWQDMVKQENDGRVLMLSFSEFGRRVAENASGGTDHGAAAPMFLFGPAVRQGIVGNHPSLTNLDEGDLRYGIDFRHVYATVLQEWLDTPARPILGDTFRTMKIIRG